MPTHRETLDEQRKHWQATFGANPDMYGIEPSQPGRYAAELFSQHHIGTVLELGAGQGRDTLAFLRAGLEVTALDYAPEALASLHWAATAAGLAERLTTLVHDVRQPLPLPDASGDGVYSHILFNMALSTAELVTLAGEKLSMEQRSAASTPTTTAPGSGPSGSSGPEKANSVVPVIHSAKRLVPLRGP